jgi:hypothetical protein
VPCILEKFKTVSDKLTASICRVKDKEQVSPKRRQISNIVNGVTYQKAVALFFIHTTVKTLNFIF